jgi:hypothetical protein
MVANFIFGKIHTLDPACAGYVRAYMAASGDVSEKNADLARFYEYAA